MFEKATRKKLRFPTTNGMLSVEDLWDLSLTQLDKLAVSLNRQIKEVGEESFISNKKVPENVQLSFDIVKHVIAVKIAEADAKKLAAERKAKRDKLMEIIEQKQNETDLGKSIDDLRKELAELEE
jgi:hypothetical protein